MSSIKLKTLRKKPIKCVNWAPAISKTNKYFASYAFYFKSSWIFAGSPFAAIISSNSTAHFSTHKFIFRSLRYSLQRMRELRSWAVRADRDRFSKEKKK
ncbi:hypothetical protein NPIL_318311 [Nephila pilipes]|uniref:Uncharacterized protein n=1 Tax=Nephila pilipes TaxID=299642 RepID=A0A8X6PML2_NEPPI|nr:hypothetical protein NPIL_318311 [Nephila pilipes]